MRNADFETGVFRRKDTRFAGNDPARLGRQTSGSQPRCKPRGLRFVALPQMKRGERAHREGSESNPATRRKKCRCGQYGHGQPKDRCRVRTLRDRNPANCQDEERKKGKSLTQQHRDGIGCSHGCPQNLKRNPASRLRLESVFTATKRGPMLPASIVIQTWLDLSRILMLLDLRLKIAAHSVNKWRRERVCGHGFYFSPTEDARLARLRRGFFFTSVRCAIFSTVPRRRYSWRIFSSISSRRS